MPVYGVLVHGLNTPVQVYESLFYFPPANDANQSARAVALASEAVAEIGWRSMFLMFGIREAAAGYGYYGVPPGTVDDAGVLCLDALAITGMPLRLVWRLLPAVPSAPSACITLVLFEHEASSAALHLLSLLPSLMPPDLRFHIAQRPEELMAFMQAFMPNGLLQVMTPALIRHMRKEYETSLK